MTSVNQSTTFLPNVSPSSLGGNSATYQAKGGQGYGFEGNSIAPGRMEITSYKSGGRRSKRRKQRKQRKSRRFRK